MSNHYPQSNESIEQELNFKQLFEQYAYYWKWFVASILICLFTAFVYLRYAERIYSINAKILLQDEKQASGDMAGLSELANFAGIDGSSAAFVNDQIEVLRSRRLMRKVVETNRLYFSYHQKGKIKSTELLEDDSPVRISFLDSNLTRVDSTDYRLVLSKIERGYRVKDEFYGMRDYEINSPLETPIGNVTIALQNNIEWNGDLQINYTPVEVAIDRLREQVQIMPNSERQSFLVNFSMNHASIDKAELIINSLIDQYNQDVTYDKAQVTRATSAFINSRLELIAKDLEEADTKVADFKDRNQLTDMEAEARLYMQTATANEQQLVEFQTQLNLADMMRQTATEGEYNLLPSNIGLHDPSIQSNIEKYNQLVLERDDLLKSATPVNPIFQQANRNPDQVRNALANSLGNYRNV